MTKLKNAQARPSKKDQNVKKKHTSQEQKIYALNQVEAGGIVLEVC